MRKLQKQPQNNQNEFLNNSSVSEFNLIY